MPARAAAAPAGAPPAEPAPKKLTPEQQNQIELARNVAAQLLKGIKQIGMYRHAEGKYGEFLAKAHEALNAYFAAHGLLQLKVELTNLALHGQELFNEDNPMPYKFYKDGIRQLIFRPGFTVEELVDFTLVALSDPDRGAEDLNTQLWRVQMPHFEYIMVEGFRMDEFSEAEVQVEVDKVVDLLQKRLRSNSEDYLRFARVSEADLEMKLDDVEQVRGVVITGVTADATMKAKVQKEVHDEETQRLFPKLLSAVFQVVEAGVDDAALLSEMFTQLLDAMLLQEDFAIINQVVLKLRAMEQRAGPDSAVGQLHRSFVAKMSEEQRLNRIGDVLKFAKLKNTADVVRYLSALKPETAPLLLDVLDAIELPENRALLIDALVPFAKVSPAAFVAKLDSDRPQMVRDMILIIDRINHPDRIKYFSRPLKSKNLATRLEVMTIIARGRTGEARTLIAQMLEDENMQIRVQAARVLPEFDRDKAFVDLMRLTKDKSWERKESGEREAIYAAIGSTGSPAAFTYFEQLLGQKGGLFDKKKVVEDKLMAIAGLGGAATIQASKLLQDATDEKQQPPEVVTAAKIQLARVRKALLGS